MAEMEDESWLCDLAFFVDITTRMNELYGHIKGFMNKLRLWHAHIQNANLSLSNFKRNGNAPREEDRIRRTT